MNPARSITLRSGEKIAALGQGTWHFAESPARRSEEVASIRLGIELGMTVIDTAEMYSNGAAEALVGGDRRTAQRSISCRQGAPAPRNPRGYPSRVRGKLGQARR
jgi:aryl-alcohol dehydrogenase-like predicted oxidoreductase